MILSKKQRNSKTTFHSESPSVTRIERRYDITRIRFGRISAEDRRLIRIANQCRRMSESAGVTAKQRDLYLDTAARAERRLYRDKSVCI